MSEKAALASKKVFRKRMRVGPKHERLPVGVLSQSSKNIKDLEKHGIKKHHRVYYDTIDDRIFNIKMAMGKKPWVLVEAIVDLETLDVEKHKFLPDVEEAFIDRIQLHCTKHEYEEAIKCMHHVLLSAFLRSIE